MFRRQNVIWKQGNFVGVIFMDKERFHHDGTIDKQGKFHGNWFDEVTQRFKNISKQKTKQIFEK